MPLPPVLNSIVSWLRAGYPQGVPESDYIPLLALLARRLTVDEVAAVAEELGRQTGAPVDGLNGHVPVAANGHVPVNNTDIGVGITKITNEMPRDEDIARVRAHLEQAGPFI